MKRFVSLSLIILLCFGFLPAEAVSVTAEIDKTVSYALGKYASPGYGDEWIVFGLARSGRAVPEDYFNTYVQNAAEELKTEQERNRVAATDYARLAITLSAIGQTPENFAGENILTYLSDMSFLEKSNLSGYVFALLAFDSKSYVIPNNGSEAFADREKIVDAILSYEVADGGFSIIRGESLDIDLTAMAVTALVPYQAKAAVAGAISRARAKLSAVQFETGGFASYDNENPESAAQVIVMLSSLGENAAEADDFLKNGSSALDSLLSFQKENGAFSHKIGGNANSIATGQALHALCAYERFNQSLNRLYDLSDVARDVSLCTDIFISDACLSGDTVSIHGQAAEACRKYMIVSSQKKGRTINIAVKPIALNNSLQSFSVQSEAIKNADTVKVFVFDDFVGLKPATEYTVLSRK